MKRIIFLLLLGATLALLVLSDFSVLSTWNKSSELRMTVTDYAIASNQLKSADIELVRSEQSFSDMRNFEISYTDVDHLIQVLNNVTGTKVSAANVADPDQSFAIGASWSDAVKATARAVNITLAVEDTISALRILNRVELPIYSISVTEPNIVSVTFLLGEGGGSVNE